MNIPALNPAAELYLNILKIEDSEKTKSDLAFHVIQGQNPVQERLNG